MPPFFHDGTERPIQRPTYMPNDCYSGKRKTHTLKNLLLVEASGYVCYLSPTCEGRVHDKRVADECGYRLPPDSTLVQDLGFLGFNLPQVTALQPVKKTKGVALTPEQKTTNRTLAALRCRIEHVIASIKRFRIVKARLRLWKDDLCDDLIEICTALHNFRLQFRPWKTVAL